MKTQQEINTIIAWFVEQKENKVIYNDKEYPNIKGTDTKSSGYYKNGFTTYEMKGKKGKRDYIQIDIYTVAKSYVDIEEKFIFEKVNDDYIVKKWVGWDNINLLKMGKEQEYIDMLQAIFIKRKN
mgnify:FL=1|jgi:hypothetical protein